MRPEIRYGHGTAYTYGYTGADEQFLAMTTLDGNKGSFISGVFSGFLVRDGVQAPLVDAKRRVIERRDGYPTRIEIEAVDALEQMECFVTFVIAGSIFIEPRAWHCSPYHLVNDMHGADNARCQL